MIQNSQTKLDSSMHIQQFIDKSLVQTASVCFPTPLNNRGSDGRMTYNEIPQGQLQLRKMGRSFQKMAERKEVTDQRWMGSRNKATFGKVVLVVMAKRSVPEESCHSYQHEACNCRAFRWPKLSLSPAAQVSPQLCSRSVSPI